MPLKGWGQTLLPGDMCGQWCDAAFSKVESLDAVALPAGGASWAGEWSLDLAGAHDPEGWRYARDFNFSRGLRLALVRRAAVAWIRGYVADAGAAADDEAGAEATTAPLLPAAASSSPPPPPPLRRRRRPTAMTATSAATTPPPVVSPSGKEAA